MQNFFSNSSLSLKKFNVKYPSLGKIVTLERVEKLWDTLNEIIKDIVVVEDNVKAYDKSNNNLVSEYDYVKGVIFIFNGYKYCFHRALWFSDDIVINKGETPETKIGNIDDDWEWGEERYSVSKRTFRSLK